MPPYHHTHATWSGRKALNLDGEELAAVQQTGGDDDLAALLTKRRAEVEAELAELEAA